MKISPFLVYLNTLFFILVIALAAYAKFFGPSVSALFLPPFFSQFFIEGLLTRIFQILCCVPPVICTFSFGLLRVLRPQCKENAFILYSALVTAGYLINEIFRIHIYLYLSFGVSKLLTVLIFGVTFLVYALTFWRRIKSTPYTLLLSSVGLLLVAIAVEFLRIRGDGAPSLLEGVPKLFSQLNITLYFCYVCYREVLRSFESYTKRQKA